MNLRFLGYYGTLVGLVIVGFLQYCRTGNNKIKRRYNERFMKIISGIFSVAFMIAFFLETWEGIGVFLERHTTTQNAGGAVIAIVPLVVMFIGFALFACLYGLGNVVAYATKKRYQKMNLAR